MHGQIVGLGDSEYSVAAENLQLHREFNAVRNVTEKKPIVCGHVLHGGFRVRRNSLPFSREYIRAQFEPYGAGLQISSAADEKARSELGNRKAIVDRDLLIRHVQNSMIDRRDLRL
jgi:hypothetical protein